MMGSESKKICPQCGALINENAKFCSSCGVLVGHEGEIFDNGNFQKAPRRNDDKSSRQGENL